ncbi:MAG: hypothetical protein WCC32_12520 [Terriglobales bacterium]
MQDANLLDNENGDDLEQYLKGFQPRTIRALAMPGEGPMPSEGVMASRVTTPGQAEDPWLRALTMAATVVLAGGFALWYGARQTDKSPESAAIRDTRSSEIRPAARISTVALTKLALDNSQAFDALLSRESQTMFPGMQGNQSALRVLAKP